MKSSSPVRIPRTEAEAIIAPAIATLNKHPLIQRVLVCGSIRRKKDTCKDADVVICIEDEDYEKAWTSDLFLSIGEPLRIGFNRGVIGLGGFNIDLWAASPSNWGSSILYATGSQKFNIWMRCRAKRKSYSLSEYGLVTRDGNIQVAGKTEEEVFDSLGMKHIAPEERGQDEIWKDFKIANKFARKE